MPWRIVSDVGGKEHKQDALDCDVIRDLHAQVDINQKLVFLAGDSRNWPSRVESRGFFFILIRRKQFATPNVSNLRLNKSFLGDDEIVTLAGFAFVRLTLIGSSVCTKRCFAFGND